MSLRLPRLASSLHRHRLPLGTLATVVAAGAMAYSVEVLILDGPKAFGGLRWLLLAGLAASLVLAVIFSHDVRESKRLGVLIHVAVLRDETWRRRNEVEHALLQTQAKARSSRASVTELSATRCDDPSAAVRRTASALLDSASIGAALMPGATRVRILAAGDQPSLTSVGYAVARSLHGWDVSLLSDRGHERGEAFVEFDVPDLTAAPTMPEARNGSAHSCLLFVPVGERFDVAAADDHPSSCEDALCRTAQVHRLDARTRLPETERAYRELAEEIAAAIPTRGTLTVGIGGPAVLSLLAGLLAGLRAPGLCLRLLRYQPSRDGAAGRYDHLTTAEVIEETTVEPLPDDHREWRLLVVQFLLAVCSTLAFGSFATMLEWSLAGSNVEGTRAQYAWLIAAILVPGLLAVGIQRLAGRLSNPDVRILLQPDRNVRPRLHSLVVQPRQEFDDAFHAIDWLREALADVRSVQPGSAVVIDLDRTPVDLLEALGSYLNRGVRGANLWLSSSGQRMRVDDPRTDVARLVRDGYDNALRCAGLWEEPGARPLAKRRV